MKTLNLKGIILLLFLYANLYAESQTALFQNKIVASDRQLNDEFGGGNLDDAKKSISIYGDYAVVGASGEDTGGDSTGKAYLYKWIASSCKWQQVDEIFAVDASGAFVGQPGDQFGFSVAIYDRIIAIGAPFDDNNGADGLGPIMGNAGIVYLYSIDPDDEVVFLQHIYQFNDLGNEDEMASDNFGFSVDLSSNHLIVGTTHDDFDEDGLSFLPGAGAAFIYEKTLVDYTFQNKVVSPTREIEDRMGTSVAIEGDFAFVGAPLDGPGGPLVSGDGIVYVFRFDLLSGNWIYEDELAPVADADDWDVFGFSMDVWNDRLIIGAPLDRHNEVEIADLGPDIAGSAYIYQLIGGVWTLDQKIVGSPRAGEDRFGWDVAIFENYAVVGAPLQDPLGTSNAGSVHLFQNIMGTWGQIQHIEAPDKAIDDEFGAGVDLYGKRFTSSAPFQDFDDDLDVPDPSLSDAGAAYMFEIVDMPEEPNITSDVSTFCIAGTTIMLDIPASDLGDADEWVWYEDDCDGASIGSGTSIIVSPTETTTYCARGESNCDWFPAGDCGCITIEMIDGFWHQSTDEGVFDRANDVITDNAGNVYATGQYDVQTTFVGSGAPITATAGVSNQRSYVVKYDNCGDLEWVAWSNNNDGTYIDYGASITFDDINGLVYVAGNFKEGISFMGGDGVATPVLMAPGSNGYVACFDAGSGAVNYIDDISLDPFTHLSAITINENNGRIYVGGEHGNTFPSVKVFVQRYSPTPGTIGPADWLIDAATYGPHKYLGDLDYDEDAGDAGNLWMIGGYKGSLRFLFGPGSLIHNKRDAFIARYEDGAMPNQTFLVKGNSNQKMFGEGITVDPESGNAYYTGHYIGATSSSFGFTIGMLPTGLNQQAYFGSITPDPIPVSVWPTFHHTESIVNNNVCGYGAVYKDGLISFTGTYRDEMTFTSGLPLPYVGTLGEHHVYVVAYDAAGFFAWRNATTDPDPGTLSTQTSTAIAADNDGHAFISGGYTFTMGYMTGASDDLEAAMSAQEETFVMRVDLGASGALESTTNDSNNEVFSAKSSITPLVNSADEVKDTPLNNFSFVLRPNPAEHNVFVQIDHFNTKQHYELKLYSLDGKLVMDRLIKANQTHLDISNLENGIYLAELSGGGQTRQLKLIKGY